MKHATLIILLVGALTGVGGAAFAQAQGLFFEQKIGIEGFTLRRVRDTKEHVVCYVLTGNYTMSARSLAASVTCLRDAP